MDHILGMSHNQGGRSVMQVIISCPLIVSGGPIGCCIMVQCSP